MRRFGSFLVVLLIASVLAGCSVPLIPGGVQGYVYIRTGYGAQSADEGGEGATFGEVEVLISAEQTAPNGYEPLVDALVHVANVRTGMGNHNYTNFQGYFMIPNLDAGLSILTVSHHALRFDVKREIQVHSGEVRWLEPIYTDGWYQDQSKTYYVIIGIENYKYRDSVPGPLEDSWRMHSMLNSSGNRLSHEGRRLTDASATKSAIRSAIQSYVNKGKSSSDHLIIYFSGISGIDFLSPYDDAGLTWNTAITDGELETWVNPFPGKVTLIIDGSHSATMADGSVLWPQAFKKYRYTVLTGAQKNEQVNHDQFLGGSVFTHFLWEGLKNGKADANNDGEITTRELYNYTWGAMDSYYWGAPDKHTPFMYAGDHADTAIYKYR